MHIRIFIGTAVTGTIPLEVVNHCMRILSYITEVDLLPTLAEEQETVEDLEQFRRRLVDSAARFCQS